MADHDKCALCGVHISSIRTRSFGGRFFCVDCGDNIVNPVVEKTVAQLIYAAGDNIDIRDAFAAALMPSADPRTLFSVEFKLQSLIVR